MKEYFVVCHMGKEKVFEEKSSAFKFAFALLNLGISVKIFYVCKTLYVDSKVLIYKANVDSIDNIISVVESNKGDI